VHFFTERIENWLLKGFENLNKSAYIIKALLFLKSFFTKGKNSLDHTDPEGEQVTSFAVKIS